MDGGADDESDEGDDDGEPEEEGVAVGEVENPERYGWTDGGCDVVAEAVIANSFCSPCWVEYIDGHSGSSHGGCSEGDTMEGAEDGKECDGCGDEVACRDSCEEEIEDDEDDLTWKGIDEVPANGTDEQSSQGIAREDYTYGFLVRSEVVAEVEWEQGHE